MNYDRRGFLKSIAAGTLMASVAGSDRQAEAAGQPERKTGPGDAPAQPPRNVVFMICDDLGYGDLGCYGSRLPTPNLDRMAAEGMRFLRFNAAHPICSASRAAVMTGRYGTRCETTGAFGPGARGGTSLDETFLSNLFHARGHRTKAIGKWHLGSRPEFLPTSRGFDSFYGVPYSDDMSPLPLIRDLAEVEADTDRTLLTPRYTEEAVKFIDETRGEAFFLYFAFSYPHDPARASPRFRGRTKFGEVGDAIAEIDWSVGEVMGALERNSLTEHTLICFTSDHGPWYLGNPGALRGRKASTFEGGFRVPFLAKWPGHIPADSTANAWCSNLDVLPTMAALCGLGLPEKPLDGVDISPVLLGDDREVERKPVLYFSPMGQGGNEIHCIRKGSWKLRVAQCEKGEIYINDRSTAARASAWLAQPELYDLSEDPAESYNVARGRPDLVAEMLKDLDREMATFPPKVTEDYAALQRHKGDITTPPGAAPRPYNPAERIPSYEPPDRRPAERST
jgi:arylsulfatase A